MIDENKRLSWAVQETCNSLHSLLDIIYGEKIDCTLARIVDVAYVTECEAYGVLAKLAPRLQCASEAGLQHYSFVIFNLASSGFISPC